MVRRGELSSYLDGLLEPQLFRDYGPNGLQVEGRDEIRKLVTGVTASLALIEAALEAGADALLVHHGLFWRGQDGRVAGWMKQRLAALLRHDLNLYAYHLPLDAHAELGNNAQLGLRLSLQARSHFAEHNLGFLDTQAAPASARQWAATLERVLGRPAVWVAADAQRARQRVAWCTGGAQGFFEAAIAAGAEIYITGEMSEPQAHLARETDCAFFACGHHASERYGAPALGQHLAETFALQHQFIDIDNPA